LTTKTYITIDEAAQILGVDPKSVSRVEGEPGETMKQVKNVYLRADAEKIAKSRQKKQAAKAKAAEEKKAQETTVERHEPVEQAEQPGEEQVAA
jgi:hypothetical protein